MFLSNDIDLVKVFSMLLLLMNMLSRVVTFSLPVSACRLQTVVVRTDSITNIARRFYIPTLWHNIFLKQVEVFLLFFSVRLIYFVGILMLYFCCRRFFFVVYRLFLNDKYIYVVAVVVITGLRMYVSPPIIPFYNFRGLFGMYCSVNV